MYFQLIFILSIGFLCSYSSAAPSTCIQVEKKPVNLTELAGTWYVIKSTKTSNKYMSACGHFDIKQLSDSQFKMTYTGKRRNNNTELEDVNFEIDGEVTGDLLSEQWTTKNSVLGYVEQAIVDVDYKSYLLTRVCLECKKQVKSLTMIWSRNKFDTSNYEELEKKFPGAKFYKFDSVC